MPKRLYRYRAVDQYGEPVDGTMEESSTERVTEILSERGIQVNTVEQVATESGGTTGRRLSWDELALFNEQLRTITRSGLPMAASLKAMARDLGKGRLRDVMQDIERSLNSGSTLDQAIQRHPNVFPPMYVSMIHAGEKTGNLPGVLDMMEQHSSRILDIKNKLKIVAAYPLMVIVMTLGITFEILTQIVPVYSDIFEEFGAGLPAPTQLLMNMSSFLIQFQVPLGVAILALVVAFVIGRRYLRSSQDGRRIQDQFLLRTPLLGGAFQLTSLARFSRSLGLMLSSGVPTIESLDLAASASGNAVLKRHVDRASIKIAGGEKIADAFSDTGYFPHAFCWFLANGENYGQLPETLLEVSHSYEQSVGYQDDAMLRLLSPVIIVGLSLFIGFVVVALYLPIFTLGDAMQG